MFILSKGVACVIFTAGGIYLSEVQHLDLVKLFKIHRSITLSYSALQSNEVVWRSLLIHMPLLPDTQPCLKANYAVRKLHRQMAALNLQSY